MTWLQEELGGLSTSHSDIGKLKESIIWLIFMTMITFMIMGTLRNKKCRGKIIYSTIHKSSIYSILPIKTLNKMLKYDTKYMHTSFWWDVRNSWIAHGSHLRYQNKYKKRWKCPGNISREFPKTEIYQKCFQPENAVISVSSKNQIKLQVYGSQTGAT